VGRDAQQNDMGDTLHTVTASDDRGQERFH
jgi:hypothetical protein